MVSGAVPILANVSSAEPPSVELPEDLQGGNAANFAFSLKSVTIGDSDPVTISPGITVVVGGNNAGKSTFLRQIASRCSQPSQPLSPPVVNRVELALSGSVADVAAWLASHGAYGYQGSNSTPTFHRPGAVAIAPAGLRTQWGREMSQLSSHFVYLADARRRHQWTGPVERTERYTDPATHPMHVIERDNSQQRRLSDICLRAFKRPLTVDWLSRQAQFRVGEPSVLAPPVDSITAEYREAVAALPSLGAQGDGMVFMLGALIPIVASTFPVILLDEPEAFLHPPQALLMGRTLAELAQDEAVQIVVATHDRNVVQGVVTGAAEQATIIRLDRHRDRTRVFPVPTQTVERIAASPVLRYSNIVDGLFHDVVVLAESERDCTFYQATMEALTVVQSPEGTANTDVLFVATNGKGNMPRFAEVLCDTGVRVVATADLDLLNNEKALKRLVTALGAEWSQELATLWRRATSQFTQQRPGRLNKDVLRSVETILSEDPGAILDPARAQRARNELRAENPWAALKTRGKYAMTSDPTSRDELLARLDAIGIVLVQQGELEGFCRDAPGGHNDEWLAGALSRDAHRSEEARAHVRRFFPPEESSAPPW